MTRLQLSAVRFVKSLLDRQRLDAEADGAVALVRRLSVHHDVRNDLPRNGEVRFLQIAGHSGQNLVRIGAGNPEPQFVAFADERKRLPIS